MKKRIYYFTTLLMMALFFSSCDCERKELALTFIFDKPIGEASTGYPNFFKEIAIPYNVECSEEGIDFLPKPISVSRLDLSKKEIKTTAWYFESIGDNTIDFSTTWLGEYFNDSLPPSYLFEPKGNQALVETFIEKNQQNSFIYSEESDLETYLNVKVFNTTGKLVEALKANACQNTEGKFYVLVNPEMKGDHPKEVAIIKNLEEGIAAIFNKLGDKEVAPEIRFNQIEEYLNLFTADANIKEFGKNGTLVGLTSVRDYFEKIVFYLTLEKIEITKTLKKPDGKIWEVRLVEHHLNDPQ